MKNEFVFVLGKRKLEGIKSEMMNGKKIHGAMKIALDRIERTNGTFSRSRCRHSIERW